MGYLKYCLDQIVCHIANQEKMFQKIVEQGPPGTLQLRTYKGNRQFVHAVPDPDRPRRYKRTGITKDEAAIASLVSAQYARTALEIIKHNKAHISIDMDRIIELTPSEIRKRMPSQYQQLPDHLFPGPNKAPGYANAYIDGITASMQDLARDNTCPEDGRFIYRPSDHQLRWSRSDYVMSDHRAEERNKETSRGLMVRSKSEVLVCEKLYEFNIPFRYEQELNIGKYSLAPDFTFLDRKGNEFYLEYCGCMDDPGYVDRFLWKRKLYESAGIYQWADLMFIFERGNDVSMTYVENYIKCHILPRL